MHARKPHVSQNMNATVRRQCTHTRLDGRICFQLLQFHIRLRNYLQQTTIVSFFLPSGFQPLPYLTITQLQFKWTNRPKIKFVHTWFHEIQATIFKIMQRSSRSSTLFWDLPTLFKIVNPLFTLFMILKRGSTIFWKRSLTQTIFWKTIKTIFLTMSGPLMETYRFARGYLYKSRTPPNNYKTTISLTQWVVLSCVPLPVPCFR